MAEADCPLGRARRRPRFQNSQGCQDLGPGAGAQGLEGVRRNTEREGVGHLVPWKGLEGRRKEGLVLNLIAERTLNNYF
jgi:hypothetical protein